jgi:succinate dehydrogenase/fumarate reductase iron-sulfur protein
MKIKVQKFDPSTDVAPYYAEGDIEYRDHMSALEALVEYYQVHEAVNFDINCTSAWCGRCAMMLNGEPTLICVAPVQDAEYVFEPLKGFPIMRDLIVDKKLLHDEISSVSRRIRIEPFNSQTIIPSDYDPTDSTALLGIEVCCRCGICNAACPAMAAYPDGYIGPAAMTALAYRHFDQLDAGDRLVEAVSSGLYYCIMCGRCDQYCPQSANINHLEIWQRLRDEAEALGLKPSYADEVVADMSQTLKEYLAG